MRKHIFLSLITLLLSLLCIFAVSAEDNVVFLSHGATGTGASADDPVGTLTGAYAALGDEGGTLVFMNEYPINGAKIDLPPHTGKVTWTNVYDDIDYRENGGALKWFTSHRVGFFGPTEIDHFHFIDNVTNGGGVLAGNFYGLTVGTDVTITDVNGNPVYKTAIVGGPNIDTSVPVLTGDSHLTVLGGTYLSVTAFSNNVSNRSHTGTMTVTLGGNAACTNCFLGARGTNALGGTTVFNMSDNASISSTLYLASNSATTNGSVTVNMTDNAKVGAFLRYLKTYFPNGTRTLNYESTVILPGTLETYFDSITQTDAVVGNLDTVYVADGGEGNGTSASAPIGTLVNAYALLGEDGGEIVLVGDTTVASALTLDELNGDVTLSASEGASLILSASITLAKNTDAYTVTFDTPITATNAVIYGGFNNVTFGENCTVTGVLDFYGGVLSSQLDTAKDTDMITELPYTLTVKGGTFRRFVGGNLRNDYRDIIGAIAAPLTVVIEDGTFTDTFNLSGDSFLSDDATLTVSGGTFACPLYVRSVSRANQARATKLSPTVTADRKYYAMDGDITIAISGGTFNGGLISAYDTSVAYTQLLRGNFTVDVKGGTFAEDTVFDATQVKAYAGESDDLASITYPDSYTFDVVRFDSVNGEAKTYNEPLRIAFVGDSITEGVGSAKPFTESYPAVFASLAKADGRDVVVANFGVSGSGALPDTEVYYCDRLSWPVLTEETDANYIVLALGTNDNAAGGVNSTRVAFEDSYKAIIDTFGALPCTEKVFITNAIARGNAETDTAQIRVATVIRPLQERIAKAYAAVDADKYVFVDFYGLTLHSAAEGPLLGTDNLHPNATGYVAMANAIYGAIFNGVTVPQTDYRHGNVYLSTDGEPYASGTEDDPTSSLAHAMALMPYDGEGTLHVKGTIEVASYLATSSLPQKLTIIGEGNGATITATGKETFKLLSDVKFDNITLKTTIADMFLIAGYNNAEFTESVTFEGNWSFVGGLFAYSGDDTTVSSAANDCTFILNCNAAFNRLLLGNCRFTPTSPYGTYSGNMQATIGDNVSVSNEISGAVGQNYLTGTATVSLPFGMELPEYAPIGTDGNGVYDAANNTGTLTVTHREEAAKPTVLFVANGGSGNGLTPENPLGSPAAAYALFDTEKDCTLVFVGKYTVPAATELPAHTGKMLWTSVYGGVDYRESGATLHWSTSYRIGFGGTTEINHLLITDAGGAVFCANFHDFTIGADVAIVDANGNPSTRALVTGGANFNADIPLLDEGKTCTVTLLSGGYSTLIGFSRGIGAQNHKGTVNLVVVGDVTVQECYLGAFYTGTGTAPTAGTTVLTLTDNAQIKKLHLAAARAGSTTGTVTVNVFDDATLSAFGQTSASYFVNEGSRTLVYDETAALPASLTDHFDNVSIRNKVDRSGDANGDGVTTLVDAIRALRATADATMEISLAADLNSDGVITIVDVLLIIKLCLNR